MAYSGRYTSIQKVVEDVFRDAGFNEVDWESAVAWTVQLMGKIGIPYQYVTKSTNGLDGNHPFICIENYRGKMPDELVNVVACRKVLFDESGNLVNTSPMIESTDLYHYTPTDNSARNTNSFSPTVNITESEIDEYGDITTEEVQYETESLGGKAVGSSSYKIQGGIITTDFKDGYVEMVYKAYPIDVNGFPMIPDDEKYMAALQHYIIYKIDWKKWRAHPASPGMKALVNDSEQQSDWYIAAARTKAHIPTIDGMEKLKNMWVRSIPKPNEHHTGFKSINKQEQRYNQYPPNRI